MSVEQVERALLRGGSYLRFRRGVKLLGEAERTGQPPHRRGNLSPPGFQPQVNAIGHRGQCETGAPDLAQEGAQPVEGIIMEMF